MLQWDWSQIAHGLHFCRPVRLDPTAVGLPFSIYVCRFRANFFKTWIFYFWFSFLFFCVLGFKMSLEGVLNRWKLSDQSIEDEIRGARRSNRKLFCVQLCLDSCNFQDICCCFWFFSPLSVNYCILFDRCRSWISPYEFK